MAEVSLELKEIKKSFTEGEAVLDNISLEISKGEFITLLGSSGCGKTTTLRIIAGLEQPDAGSVWLDGREVTGLEPNQRDVNTVFQNYALFPHMNVAENIGYGLKLKKFLRVRSGKKFLRCWNWCSLKDMKEESLLNSRAVRNRELPLREHW